jgi:hypothetical protein
MEKRQGYLVHIEHIQNAQKILGRKPQRMDELLGKRQDENTTMDIQKSRVQVYRLDSYGSRQATWSWYSS